MKKEILGKENGIIISKTAINKDNYTHFCEYFMLNSPISELGFWVKMKKFLNLCRLNKSKENTKKSIHLFM
ncbi:MAG: hypothetical protein AUJ97_02355 [Bacteroidetes bacterium CG2_30_32_10]|nr:MAG: hypothetical protein AUJ97_02355 [Bacteroidetes bacterium CG2_30_32_10]